MAPKQDDSFTPRFLMAIIQASGIKTPYATYDAIAKELGVEMTANVLRQKFDKLKKEFGSGLSAGEKSDSPIKKTPAKKRKAGKKAAGESGDGEEATPKKVKVEDDAEGEEDGLLV